MRLRKQGEFPRQLSFGTDRFVDRKFRASLEFRHRSDSGEGRMGAVKTLKAIATDVQFWIPAAVLALGIGLLVWLH